jgi:ATP-dependent DNA ligase
LQTAEQGNKKLRGQHRKFKNGNGYTMVSRNDDLITSMPHIEEELRQLPEHVTLDGEIYLHGASLQYHSSMIRSHEPEFGHHEFKYVVFDIQDSARYYFRRQLLINLFANHNFKHIQLLESTPGKRTAAQSYMQQYRALGYEGAILRAPEGYYTKDSRSYSVQKVKQTLFARYPVVKIVCSDKGREKGLAIVECLTNEGKTFRARIAKSEDIRRFIYQNRSTFLPAGADIEFSDFTEAGIPQHPRCTQIYKGMKLAKATDVQNI